MIEWPEELVHDIAARRAVIFLGAGVSRNSTNPDGEHPKEWAEFLEILSQRVSDPKHCAEIRQCVSEGDLLTACELARKYLSAADFKSELLREFSSKGYRHAQIHDDISAIDSRIVMTTNFDKIYENRANYLQNNTVLVKNYYEGDAADIFRRKDRAVLKIHGTIDSPEKIIFTRSQYAMARRDFGHFYNILRGLFITHTFVFLGASMRDPDIQMILEDHAYRFEGTRPHYIVMPTNTSRLGSMRVLEETMNLRALQYNPDHNHKELSDSISALVQRVEAERVKISETAAW